MIVQMDYGEGIIRSLIETRILAAFGTGCPTTAPSKNFFFSPEPYVIHRLEVGAIRITHPTGKDPDAVRSTPSVFYYAAPSALGTVGLFETYNVIATVPVDIVYSTQSQLEAADTAEPATSKHTLTLTFTIALQTVDTSTLPLPRPPAPLAAQLVIAFIPTDVLRKQYPVTIDGLTELKSSFWSAFGIPSSFPPQTIDIITSLRQLFPGAILVNSGLSFFTDAMGKLTTISMRFEIDDSDLRGESSSSVQKRWQAFYNGNDHSIFGDVKIGGTAAYGYNAFIDGKLLAQAVDVSIATGTDPKKTLLKSVKTEWRSTYAPSLYTDMYITAKNVCPDPLAPPMLGHMIDVDAHVWMTQDISLGTTVVSGVSVPAMITDGKFDWSLETLGDIECKIAWASFFAALGFAIGGAAGGGVGAIGGAIGGFVVGLLTETVIATIIVKPPDSTTTTPSGVTCVMSSDSKKATCTVPLPSLTSAGPFGTLITPILSVSATPGGLLLKGIGTGIPAQPRLVVTSVEPLVYDWPCGGSLTARAVIHYSWTPPGSFTLCTPVTKVLPVYDPSGSFQPPNAIYDTSAAGTIVITVPAEKLTGAYYKEEPRFLLVSSAGARIVKIGKIADLDVVGASLAFSHWVYCATKAVPTLPSYGRSDFEIRPPDGGPWDEGFGRSLRLGRGVLDERLGRAGRETPSARSLVAKTYSRGGPRPPGISSDCTCSGAGDSPIGATASARQFASSVRSLETGAQLASSSSCGCVPSEGSPLSPGLEASRHDPTGLT